MATCKKISYKTLFLFIITFLFFSLISNLQAQWSTDPNNNLIVGYGLDPHICSDSAGGCYISYDFDNIYYPRKLALERLDIYGYKPWGINKQILGELPEQSHAEIIEDGEGGVIISYEDRFEDLPITEQRVRVQRVDSSGNFLWGTTGAIVTLEEINHGKQQLVTDGSGGCVVIWKTTTRVFYINRISAGGERLWSDSGKVLGISNYSGTEPRVVRATDGSYYAETGEYIYRIRGNGEIVRRDSVTLGYIVPDPEGGIVLSGSANWSINGFTLVAQRKDSLGNNLWQEPYVEIADSIYINAIINVKRIDNYYYYTWHGRKNGIDLVAQFQALRSDGTKLFNQGSLPMSNYPVDALIGNILPSDSGTFVLIWQDYRQDDGVFGQRKDTLGNPLWNLNDVPLYDGTYSELYAIIDCAGGAIGIGWHQFDFSIRAFKVSKNGILGEVITNIVDQHKLIFPDEIVLFQNYPNPFNSSTSISYQITNAGSIKILLYNVLGEQIKTLLDEYKNAGIYSMSFNANDLPSGVYLYILKAGLEVMAKKLTILK